MKTNNLKLDLIEASQVNKEVFFNENLCVLDSFAFNNIRAMVPAAPTDEFKNEKFIITEGEHKNKICYATHPSKEWRFLDPIAGMAFFCSDAKSFFYFDGENWVPFVSNTHSEAASVATVPEASAVTEISFKGGAGDFPIINELTYLYLSGNTKIILAENRHPILQIIIKQNHASVFNVQFDAPILWKDKVVYTSTRTANRIDYIRLIRLPETEHYLGEIVNIGYSY